MMDIEKQLKAALRRCDPPEGFAQRILAQVAISETKPRQPARRTVWRWPLMRWVAIPVFATLLILGFWYRGYQQQREEAAGRAARQQVMLALRITGTKLRMVKAKVKAAESGAAKAENTL
jgi:hypothetical protein